MAYQDSIPGTIIGISSICILSALPLIGFSVVAKPAHPATRGTRIAWYLTVLATLILLSSHIPPLVTAIQHFIDRKPMPAFVDGLDLGPVTFALQGLTIILEIAACRILFYVTTPLRSKQWEKRRLVIVDSVSFILLVGSFIGSLAVTAGYKTGMCYGPCNSPRKVASVFFYNSNSSAGMPFVSIFSLIVVIAGAGFGAKSSPHSPLAQSLRILLPLFASLQIVATVAAVATGISTYNSESWEEQDYDAVYYATIPLWLVEISVLGLLQISLWKKKTGVRPVEETDHDLESYERVTGQ